jgi:hypothetical protein
MKKKVNVLVYLRLIGKQQHKIMQNKTRSIRRQEKKSRTVSWLITDQETHQSERVSFEHTKHSKERSLQRNIGDRRIEMVLEYGEPIFGQGLIYYILGEKNIPDVIKPKEQKKYKNLVVIVSTDSAMIVTCYRSKNPFKHIKKKRKSINKQFNNAA